MRERSERGFGLPDRQLLPAAAGGRPVAYARTLRFITLPDSPSHVAPEGHCLIGLRVASGCRRRGLGLELTRRRLEWDFDRARRLTARPDGAR